MSERKVLNKYYPPDFDPTKLPKLKRERNRQFVIRIMAPFSMCCNTCGEYIYKGRKFNSRMETVENETYLGLRIYRFYIRCTKCITEITFKTDPENTDYVMEHGAKRNFEAYKKMEEKITREKKAKEEEEANNPMKALENRTRDSKKEMDSLEKLEELKDLNRRAAAIDPEQMIHEHLKVEKDDVEKQRMREEEEDELLVQKMFRGAYTSGGGYLKRLIDSNSDNSDNSDNETTSKKVVQKRTLDDLDNYVSLGEDMPGPSIQPPKKSKLKTPFDDLAKMIVKKKITEKKEETIPVVEKIKKDEINEEQSEKALPAYKINLKKSVNKNNTKMKGTSLSLLGGYNSSGSSSDE